MNAVYLAGAINGKTDSECNDWRQIAIQRLYSRVRIFDPMVRDYRGKEDENVGNIVEGDKQDICECNFMIVNATQPSWGTAMEIHHAYTSNVTIVAFVGEALRISPWLRYHTHKICKTVEEACDYVCAAVAEKTNESHAASRPEVELWCLLDPQGNLRVSTLSENEWAAFERFVSVASAREWNEYDRLGNNRPKLKDYALSKGWRAMRVTVKEFGTDKVFPTCD